jgi:hypothetical protein
MVVVAEAVIVEKAAEVAGFATSCVTVRIMAERLEELDSGVGDPGNLMEDTWKKVNAIRVLLTSDQDTCREGRTVELCGGTQRLTWTLQRMRSCVITRSILDLQPGTPMWSDSSAGGVCDGGGIPGIAY